MKKSYSIFAVILMLLSFALNASAASWYLVGSVYGSDKWTADTSTMMTQVGSSNQFTKEVNLTSGTYEFKIVKDTEWLGKDQLTLNGFPNLQAGKLGNAKFTVTATGKYQFTLDAPSTGNPTVTLSQVVDPVTIKGDYNLAYNGNYPKVYAYNGSNNNTWPGVEMTSVVGSDGKTYKVTKIADAHKGTVIFNNKVGETGNQTGDLAYTSSFVMNDAGATNIPVVFEPEAQVAPEPPVFTVSDDKLFVSISSPTEGAEIRYTTDGATEPTSASTLYNDKIRIPVDGFTLKAIAIKGNMSSTVTSQEIAYTKPVAPTIKQTEGSNLITITRGESETGVKVYYTTDGSDPATSTTKKEYTAPFNARFGETTVKAITMRDADGGTSLAADPLTITYVNPAAPEISDAVYNKVTIKAESGATIYYTIDGNVPTTSSTKYTEPIEITANCTVKAIAVRTDGGTSPAAEKAVTYVKPEKHFVYYDGTFSTPYLYAWKGKENVNLEVSSAKPYPGDLMVKKEDNLWYWELPLGKPIPENIIISDGNGNKVGLGDLVFTDKSLYHQNGSSELKKDAAPTITVDATTNMVTITPSIAGADVRYTTDGTEPTKTSTQYTAPFAIGINNSYTVKAVAYTEESESKVAEKPVAYTGPAKPTVTVADNVITITNVDTEEGVKVYYTTDGTTEPTLTSTEYTTPIDVTVNGTTTVWAAAIRPDGGRSEIVKQTFTYVAPAAPTIAAPANNKVTITAAEGLTIRYTTGNDAASTADPTATTGTVYDAATGIEVTPGGIYLKAITVDAKGGISAVAGKAIAYDAPDGYYMVGQFNNWNQSANPMTLSGSLYTATVNIPADKKGFKILYKRAGQKDIWYGSNNAILADNGSLTLEVKYAINTNVNFANPGEHTVKFNPTTLLLTDGNYLQWPEKLYGAGNVKDWSAPSATTNKEIKYTTDGVYTFTVESTGSNYISISKYNGADWNAFRGSDSDPRIVTSKTSAEYVVQKDNDETTVVFSKWGQFDFTKAGIYTITIDLNAGKATFAWSEPRPAAPTFTFNEGNNTVTIKATAGNSIHYTLNGSEPTTSSALYTAPVRIKAPLDAKTTVKAIAVKGDKTSEVASEVFTYVAPAAPVFIHNAEQNFVSLKMREDGATVRYTDAETILIKDWPEFPADGVRVPTTGLNLKAIAYDVDGVPSAMTSQSFDHMVVAPDVKINATTGRVTITNNYRNADDVTAGTLHYQIIDKDGKAGKEVSDEHERVTLNLTATSTVKAWVTVETLKSAETTTKWSDPKDVPTLYYMNAITGWNILEPMKFNFDTEKDCYYAEMTFPDDKPHTGADTGNVTDNEWWRKFKIAPSPEGSDNWMKMTYDASKPQSDPVNVEKWRAFNRQSLILNSTTTTTTTTIPAKAPEEEPVWNDLTPVGSEDQSRSRLALVVEKRGIWKVYVSRDLKQISATYEPLRKDVNRATWSLENMKQNDTRYFYLSREQNDSRVTPEWELQKQADGSYAINNFMVIPAGQFIIRKIHRQDVKGDANDFVITDYAYDNTNFPGGAYHLNDVSLNLPGTGKAEERTYSTAPIKVTPLGSNTNTKRGFYWNVGYTMASVKFEENVKIPAIMPTIIENEGRPVVYYKGSFTTPTLYLYDESGTPVNGGGGAAMQNAGNGFWAYPVSEAEMAKGKLYMVFKPSTSSWANQIPPNGVKLGIPTVPTLYQHSATGVALSDYEAEGQGQGPAVTMSVDFTQPSTLDIAPKPGVPYVALMGEYFAAPKGDTQKDLDYIAKIDNDDEGNRAPNLTGFTNGYIYYNADGDAVTYGPKVDTRTGIRNGVATNLYYLRGAENNMNSYGNNYTYSGYNPNEGELYKIKEGKAIYSTRQPSVYPIQFYGVLDGKEMNLTSAKTQLKYQGEQQVTVTNPDNPTETKTIRAAVYKTTGIPLLGKVKLFTGFGGSKYGATYNGLSLHHNWGYGASDKGAYTGYPVTDGADLPLSGGGGRHIDNNFDRTVRPETETTISKSNYNYEDNLAGAYAEFKERTYVSEMLFYYALETDGLDDLHAVNKNQKPDEIRNEYDLAWPKRITNSGRNWSWMKFSFTKAPLAITLERGGNASGIIGYSINDGQEKTHDEVIEKYKVVLNRIENDAAGTVIEQVWDSGEIAGQRDINGNYTQYTLEAAEQVVKDLPNGWYEAKITSWFLRANTNALQTSEARSEVSTRIRIYGQPVKPQIKAQQVITRTVEGTEYTFDVDIESDLKDAINQQLQQTRQEWPDATFDDVATNLRCRVTIPASEHHLYVQNPETKEYEQVDPGVEKFKKCSYSNNIWTYTNNESYFSSTKTSIPKFRVKYQMPHAKRTYTITVWYMANGTSIPENSNSAEVTIVAPEARYKGVARFEANWDASKYDGYTSVKVPNGQIEYFDENGLATLEADTRSRYAISYNVSLTKNDGTTQAIASNLTTSDGKAVMSGLPYNTDLKAQSYPVTTDTHYLRICDNVTSDVIGSANALDVSELTLKGPRDDISADDANDYIRITTKWEEKWGGANSQVEDALVMAKVSAPSEGTVYKVDATKQTINHKPESIFHPDNYLVSTDGKTTNEKSPGRNITNGEEFWNAINTKDKSGFIGQHPNFVERVGRPNNYNGALRDAVVNKGSFNDPKFAVWAGEKPDFKADASWTSLVDYGQATKFDKTDASRGYYDNRNVHTRKGWHGGELFSRDWYVQAVAQTTRNTYDITQYIYEVPDDVRRNNTAIMDALKANVKAGSGLPKVDTEMGAGITGVTFGRDVFLKPYGADPATTGSSTGTGRIMLKINHVNHESWFGKDKDVMEQWKEDSELSSMTFGEKLNAIRIVKDDYEPITYSFEYEYPMLTSYAYVNITGTPEPAPVNLMSAAKAPVAPAYAAGDAPTAADITPVKRTATGTFAFTGAIDNVPAVPTAVEDLAADVNESGISIVYDHVTGRATVISADPLKKVFVTAASGVQMIDATSRAFGMTEVDIDMSALDNAAYLVTAVRGNGKTQTLKVLK